MIYYSRAEIYKVHVNCARLACYSVIYLSNSGVLLADKSDSIRTLQHVADFLLSSRYEVCAGWVGICGNAVTTYEI